jgi:hypothetical protein
LPDRHRWLADVFVDESARERGIGTWMVGVTMEIDLRPTRPKVDDVGLTR